MGFMDWTDEYGLGVDSMDDQHKGLIASMNHLHERAVGGAAAPEIIRLVDELAALTQAHFADEEVFMASFDYEDLAKHRLIHTNLLSRLGQHRDALVESGQVGQDFFDFLKFWLSSHICGIDAKYAAASKGSVSQV